MTNKELKHLRRSELLELLITQGKQMEQMEQELEAARKELSRREIAIAQSGSLAEAALRLSGTFEAIDAAIEQYIDNLEMRLVNGEQAWRNAQKPLQGQDGERP